MTRSTFVTNRSGSWLALTMGIVGAAILLTGPFGSPAFALDFHSLAGKAGGAARDKAVKEVNAKLLAEGRKNQCSFKSDSDQLAPGCDKKIKKLADELIDAKKKLQAAGVSGFKFVVSGHTDSAGKPEHNKELSAKRAAVIQREYMRQARVPPTLKLLSPIWSEDQ